MAIQYDPIQPVSNPLPAPRVQYNQPPSMSPVQVGYNQHMAQSLPPDSNPFGLLGQNGLKTGADFSSFLGLLGGFGSLFSTILNMQYQKQANEDQKKWQKEFYDYTFEKQREEYWKQQEYNTPANQLARLTAAGLNPNLAYGSGGAVNAGNAQALNPAGESGRYTPSVPFFDASSVIQNLLQPLQAFSQMHLNQGKTIEALEAAGLSKSNAVKIGLLTPLEQSKMNQEISNLVAQEHNIRAQIIKTHADAKTQNIYNQIAAKMYQAQLNQIKLQNLGIIESTQLTITQQEKCYQEIYQIIPAMAKSYAADASQKWAIAKQITELLPSHLKEAAARAGIAEKDFNNYFWTQILPSYFGAGVGAASKLGAAAIVTP